MKPIQNFQKRGEISVKGKGIMTTYWVLGKGVSASQIISPGPTAAGIPQSQTPSLQRQTSHHSSLAAVVFGMMQATKRTNINSTTRKYPSDNQNISMWTFSYFGQKLLYKSKVISNNDICVY